MINIPAFVIRLHCANTAERIEVLLRVDTLALGPSYYYYYTAFNAPYVGHKADESLDASPDFPLGFDAAFVKLLRPLVVYTSSLSHL